MEIKFKKLKNCISYNFDIKKHLEFTILSDYDQKQIENILKDIYIYNINFIIAEYKKNPKNIFGNLDIIFIH